MWPNNYCIYRRFCRNCTIGQVMEKRRQRTMWLLIGAIFFTLLSCEKEDPGCYEFVTSKVNFFYYDEGVDLVSIDTLCPKIITRCNITSVDFDEIIDSLTFYRTGWYYGLCMVPFESGTILLDSVYIIEDQFCKLLN